MATPGQRHLAMREEERRVDESGRRASWAFLWTLFGFKIATLAIIWYAATSSHSRELPFIIATTWYWFAIPALAISGPLLYRWRLVRQRRRRSALQGAEWMDRAHHAHDSTLTVDELIREHDRKRA